VLSLRLDQRHKGKRKGPVHRWRAFEVRALLAHDTSHDPPWVVVVVVVEAMHGWFIKWTVSARYLVGKGAWPAWRLLLVLIVEVRF